MSIASISFTVVNLYTAQGARAPSASTSVCGVPPKADDDAHTDRGEHAVGRRNVLVDAMMTALKELGLTGGVTADAPATASAATAAAPAVVDTTPAVATPAAASTDAASTGATSTVSAPAAAGADAQTTSTVGTTATDAASGSVDVSQAVAQFAHALWGAVRGTDAAKAGEVGVDNDNHTGTGRRHHHRHVQRSEHGYENLAQRLEALASTTDPAAASLKTTTDLAQRTVASATSAPADATATTSTSTATTDTTAAATPAATTTPVTASPLAEAFGKLLTALQGDHAPSASDSASLLGRFLHTLAVALRPSSAANATPGATGSLINVTA